MTETTQPQASRTQRSADSQLKRNWATLRRNKAALLGRIIYGSRVSLLIAIGVVAVGLLVGLPLGLISGYYGGKVDFGIQRVTDTMLAFPGFLLALALVAVLGVGLKNTIISVGISMVPLYIRLGRGCTLLVQEQTYVEAARAMGTRE